VRSTSTGSANTGETGAAADRDAERAPADRTPAAAEVAQEPRAQLALEPLHRRHGDEHERHRAPDPDRGREQVNDEERCFHSA
jgi:hypothetical protein